jgi:hypothetical protein
MRRLYSAGAILVFVVATTFARGATMPVSASPDGADAALQAPAATAAELSMAQSWERPLDVVPLPPEGQFRVISQTPWPGEKVRVFFFGIQG